MLHKFHWFSLKKELTVYFFVSSTLILFILGFILYPIVTQIIQEKVKKDQILVLENQLQLVETNVESLEHMIIRISGDKNLLEILNRSEGSAGVFNESAQNFYMALEERMAGLKPYISVLHVKGGNGFTLRKGFESYSVDFADYQEEPWYYDNDKSSGEIIWNEMRDNFTRIPHVEAAADSDYIVPVYKTICRMDDREPVGTMVVLATPGLFLGDDLFREKNADNTTYIADRNGNIIYTNKENANRLRDSPKKNIEELFPISREKLDDGTYDMVQDGDNLVTAQRSKQTGMYLIRVSSWSPMLKQESHVLSLMVLALFLMILLSIVLSLIFSSRFTKPIEEIVKKITKIASGDFTYQICSVPGERNFQLVYENLNRMESDIQIMMEDNRRKEQEKRELELQMLQMQINPHFLYNTLNSIKWMASFQGAKGIETMASSLGIVLQAAYSRIDEMIPLKEELDVLQSYFLIQKIRYEDKLNMEIDWEEQELADCLIPRFTLQPIVENSIFHGIASKSKPGHIWIHIRREEERVVIHIRDDGIGMEQEVLSEISDVKAGPSAGKGLKGIGLGNVRARLQLAYGPEYGLTIQSRLGEYTEVTVFLREMRGGCSA